jgi:hypothetical protein
MQAEYDTFLRIFKKAVGEVGRAAQSAWCCHEKIQEGWTGDGTEGLEYRQMLGWAGWK